MLRLDRLGASFCLPQPRNGVCPKRAFPKPHFEKEGQKSCFGWIQVHKTRRGARPDPRIAACVSGLLGIDGGIGSGRINAELFPPADGRQIWFQSACRIRVRFGQSADCMENVPEQFALLRLAVGWLGQSGQMVGGVLRSSARRDWRLANTTLQELRGLPRSRRRPPPQNAFTTNLSKAQGTAARTRSSAKSPRSTTTWRSRLPPSGTRFVRSSPLWRFDSRRRS